MVATETKFRNWAKKEFPNGFIKKIPDFKQLGSAGAVGLPDYMIILDGNTLWYEVKSGFGNTLTLKHFTDGQKITFTKMLGSGVDVSIFCFTKTKGLHETYWSTMLQFGKIKFK